MCDKISYGICRVCSYIDACIHSARDGEELFLAAHDRGLSERSTPKLRRARDDKPSKCLLLGLCNRIPLSA